MDKNTYKQHFFNFMTTNILMQGTKSTLLKQNSEPRAENIQFRQMLYIETCILRESEFQKQGFSLLTSLFGFISMLISRNDMMQRTLFQKTTAKFYSEYFRIVKNKVMKTGLLVELFNFIIL